MECEMCGKNNANTIANVEDVRMNVCTSCASHGEIVQRAPRPTSTKRHSFMPQEEHEFVERINPDTPKLLRAHREQTGLSLHDFAQKLNIKASVYQHFESGSRLPSTETARKLGREIGKSLVVKVQIKKGSYGQNDTPGMTFKDFLK